MTLFRLEIAASATRNLYFLSLFIFLFFLCGSAGARHGVVLSLRRALMGLVGPARALQLPEGAQPPAGPALLEDDPRQQDFLPLCIFLLN